VELKDIKAIIDLMRKNDLSVFEMEKDGFRLKLQKGATEKTVGVVPLVSAAAAAPVAAPPATAPAAEDSGSYNALPAWKAKSQRIIPLPLIFEHDLPQETDGRHAVIEQLVVEFF
jgi:acetyl-CoA carboxylase biotin carboxyl carrier protein